MSLIQEALKRQQEEAQPSATPKIPPPVGGLKPKAHQPSPPPTPIPAPTPPPLPAAPTTAPAEQAPVPQPEEAAENPPEKEAKSTLLVVLLVIFLLAGAGIAMAYFAWSKMVSARQFQPATNAAPSAAVAVDAVVTQAPPCPPAPPAEPAIAKTTAVETQQIATATSNPALAILPPPPDTKPGIQWPALELKSIMGKGTQGGARINKQLVLVGESIEGVTLKELVEQGVVLEFQGQREVLKVGGTLP